MMKYLSIIFLLISTAAYGQKTYVIPADSTKLTTVNGTGNELIIENDTRDTLGVLANKGGGRTDFKALRLQQLTDSTFRLLLGTSAQGQTVTIPLSSYGGGGSGGRSVDSIWRENNKDSIIFSISGTRYAVKDSFENGVLLLDTAEVDYFTVINLLNTPPGAPAVGATYTVGTSPTGAWVGNANAIAEWNGSSWDFTTPTQGDYYYNQTNGYTYQFRSGAWVRTSSIPVLVNGQSLSTGVRLGTNNAKSLTFETNNVNRARVDSQGVFYVYNVPVSSTGDTFVVKWNSVTGNFSRVPQSDVAGGGSITASNGLTLSGSDVQLGGVVTTSTYIDNANNRGGIAFVKNGQNYENNLYAVDNSSQLANIFTQVDTVNNTLVSTLRVDGVNGSVDISTRKTADDTARLSISGIDTRNNAPQVLAKDTDGYSYWRDVSSIGGGSTDSATFATKNYVNSLNAQWSVSRTADSSNFVFTNGATATQIRDNGWTLLATSNVSNTTSVDFTLPSGYSNYMIDMDTVYAATAGAGLWLRVGTPTIQSGASDYKYTRVGAFNGASAITYSAGASEIQVFGTDMPGTGGRNNSLSGTVMLHQPADNILHKKVQVDLTGIGNTGTLYQFQGWGWYASSTAYTVIRIMCSTGNIYGGFRLYGMK